LWLWLALSPFRSLQAAFGFVEWRCEGSMIMPPKQVTDGASLIVVKR